MENRLLHLFSPTAKNTYRSPLLRSRVLTIYAVLLVLFQVISSFFLATQSREVQAATPITEKDILYLSNKERSRNGLEPLGENEFLKNAAFAKGVDMLTHQYWAHVSPVGKTPWEFILSAGYNYLYAGENLAKDFQTAEGVVSAWLESPSHRQNILSPHFTEIGVAVVSGQLNGTPTTLVVQMLGSLSLTLSPAVTKETPVQIVRTQRIQPVARRKVEIVSAVNDTTPPLPPRIKTPKDGDLINESRPEMGGMAEAGSTVSLFDGDDQLGSVPTDTENAFSFRPEAPLVDGLHTVTATAKDLSGNVSSSSEKVAFLLDTIPPYFDLKSVTAEPFWRGNSKAFLLSARVVSEPESVSAKLENYGLLLAQEEKGLFRGILAPPEEMLGTNRAVSLIANDIAGNRNQVTLSLPSPPPRFLSARFLAPFRCGHWQTCCRKISGNLTDCF